MFRYSIALILALLLTGCPWDRAVKTVPTYITIEKPLDIPDEYLAKCPVTHGVDRSVNEYVRVAITNTPALEQCAKQIEAIRELNTQAQKKGLN